MSAPEENKLGTGKISSLVLSTGMSSMAVTMTRQAALPLIFAYLLSRAGSLNSLWYCFVLAELGGLPLAICLWKRGYRRSLPARPADAA